MKAVMYHYVRPDEKELPYFKHLHIDDFKQQLDYFEKEYGFVSKDDFIKSFKTGEVQKGVVLTFDDGVKDHIDYVLPELKKRGLWGVFYISSGVYERKKLLDVHRIHMLLGKYGGERIAEEINKIVTDEMLSHGHVEDYKTMTYKRQENDEIAGYVKRTLNFYISYEHRENILNQLIATLFPNQQELFNNFYLNDNEIATLEKEGMVVGSHTVNHPVMSKLSVAEQKFEITSSFNYLQNVTGGLTLKTFCYPYGGFHSFTDDTEKLLDEYGCLFSFNVEFRDINSTDLLKRPQALPRYDTNCFPFGQCRD